jgi:phospholipid/cholesterol/gamma-HCH transport system ATP-binding protein
LSGTVKVDGADLFRSDGFTREAILKKFGVLFQSGALLGSLTLGENVALPLMENRQLSRKMIDDLVRLKLSLVGLEDKTHLYPSELSGGMKKRGGLARALIMDPEIIFFDEPSAGLDPVTQAELDELILDINRKLGATIVVVTHELQSIFKIAQRVIMLDKDTHTIIAEGDPFYLKDNAAHPRVRSFFRREALGKEG